MQSIHKLNKILQESGKYISGVAIVIMMLIIVSDVVMRNFLHLSFPGSYEIIEKYLMPLAIFPALGYVYMSHVLPRLNEFIERRSQKFQKFNRLLLLLIDVVVFILLTYYTFLYALDSYQQGIAVPVATKFVPLWPIYFFVPLGYALVLFEVVVRFVDEVKPDS
ncbi:MAG: TRAP transporter small permease [Bacilli bacterium]|nr:TRAP transporter small permease [Bacilli bacterium]